MPKGCKPWVKLGTKWYLEISNASVLQERVITRGSTLNFSNKMIQLEQTKMVQLHPPTKKWKAPELLAASDSSINDEITEASSSLTKVPPTFYSLSSPSPPSSLSLPLPLPLPCPLLRQEISYWDSTEAKKNIRPLQNESDALCAIDNQIKLKDANEAPQSYL